MSKKTNEEIKVISESPKRRPYASKIAVILGGGYEFGFDGEACLLTDEKCIVRAENGAHGKQCSVADIHHKSQIADIAGRKMMKKLFVIFSVLSAILIMANVNPSVWAQEQGVRLFDARMDFPTGDSPYSVAIGDLNGDGCLDLATANCGSDDVSILLGNGDGTFQTATNYGAGDGPYSVAIGDLNGDGCLDLATANFNGDDVSILIGNGDGTFQTAANYGVGAFPISVAIGDLNGDGCLDLATANYYNDDVSILIGNGDGTFQTATNYGVGDLPGSVAIGDLNGDGCLDLATANGRSDDVSILLGNGDGTFQTATNYGAGDGPCSVAIGDLNGDGWIDLATANWIGWDLSILLGNGDGTFQTAANYGVGDGPMSVAIGDLNGDGCLDLATANYYNDDLSILLGNGDGTFQTAANYGVGAGPYSVAIGDLNGDGWIDLATANGGSDDASILLGNGDGTFQTATNYGVGDYPRSVAIGDLNGDGCLDLATANRGSDDASILLGNGDGTFQTAANYGVGAGPYSVAIGDLNGDGWIDLATANCGSNDVSILLGNGDGTFQTATNYGVGAGPYSVAIEDLNGDGCLDLATANCFDRDVSILLGNGDGTFQTAANYGVGNFPMSVAIGDLNGDGCLDLANCGSDDVSILLGNGDGTFQTAANYGVGNSPYSVAIGDLNGDGCLDLATANYESDDVSVLIGNGDGTFQTAANYGVGNCPRSVAIGDLDGDGYQDLATANSWGGDVSVLIGNGDGTFQTTAYYGAGDAPYSVAIGDLNGDGYLDLATANYFDDDVGVLIHSRRVAHSPNGRVAGPVDAVRYYFVSEMDSSSFTIEDDVVSFVGPQGALTVAGFVWLDERTLEITFVPQTTVGEYEMVIGPEILDSNGNPMNLDRDSTGGEVPDDQYAATFMIKASKCTGHTPSGSVMPPGGSICFSFDHDMDETSFSLADDIVSFTGPQGIISPTGYSWVDQHTLEVTFEPQYSTGVYEMVLGPEILDMAGNAMDQDGDLVPGEVSDDRYLATFMIKASKCTGHTPSGSAMPPVDSICFSFDHDMDETSFSLADDIASFTGPQGIISPTGYSWVDQHTLEINFEPQYSTGVYEMVLGPEILDIAGNAMDQDGDLVPGEVPDDQYTATFAIAYSGTLEEDTTWSPEYGPIVVDGTLTVPSGLTLIIEAGTVVKSLGSSDCIDVQGSLEVFGTPEQPVILTSWQDDSVGGDTNGDGGATSPATGDWQGIRFGSSGAVGALENIEIRYAEKAIDGAVGGTNISLRNCVLRDGVYGIYVYTPYVEIDAENCLIVDNSYTGIFVRADSREVFRNCTIVGNGFQGSDWTAAGIHIGAANLLLENCIVAFNANGLHHSGAAPTLAICNSIFHNHGGSEIYGLSAAILQENGNILSDPLFVNRMEGDYELDAGSPAIDAAHGISSLTQDILGRSRYDDPGVPNTGTGVPWYVDIGAYERQGDTESNDLAVTSVEVSGPEFVTVGESFTVEWTVRNEGTLDCTGSWPDTVYLSDDPYVSSDDVVLATLNHDGPLVPGTSYTQTLNVTVPEASGPKYVLVYANSSQTLSEAYEENNVGVSSQTIGVDILQFEMGTPQSSTISGGEWQYYRFDAQSGRTVLFTLDSTTTTGSVPLYIRYGSPPTASDFDACGAVPNQPDQEARLLEPIDGAYYVGIYAQWLPGGSTNYTISAELTDLDIRQVSPAIVGNADRATIKIEGDNFDPNSQVQLAGSSNTIDGETYYQDPSTLFATFDLAGEGADPGLYDVVITNPDLESVIEHGAVTVTEGGAPDFIADLSMPGRARPGRVITVRIDYSNPSTIDVNSPILTLDSGVDDCEWQLPDSDSWVVGPDFRIMALSSDGPATVLRPGQSESITVRLRIPFRPEDITVRLSSLGATPTDGSANLIDWQTFEDDIRPEGVDDETWDPVFARLKIQIGDTWGDYAQTLRENANRWSAAGRRAYSAPELFLMELDRAYQYPTGIVAGRVIDIHSQGSLSGIRLSLKDTDGFVMGECIISEEGKFGVGNLEQGTYIAEIEGYLISNQEAAVNLSGDFTWTEIHVIKGAEIIGTVTGPDNEAVESAVVRIVDTFGNEMTTVTDELGKYRIVGVPLGRWEQTVFREGLVSPDSEVINVTNAGQVVSMDLSLFVGGKVSGVVTDLDGNPVAGAYVSADQSLSYDVTDSQGHYEVGALPSGNITIRCFSDEFAAEDFTVPNLGLNQVLENMNLVLFHAVVISGSIRTAQGLNVTGFVVIWFEDIGDYALGYANDGGYLTMPKFLDPGNHRVTVYGNNIGHGYKTSNTLTLEIPESEFVAQLDVTLDENLFGCDFPDIELEHKLWIISAATSYFENNGWVTAAKHLKNYLNLGAGRQEKFDYPPTHNVAIKAAEYEINDGSLDLIREAVMQKIMIDFRHCCSGSSNEAPKKGGINNKLIFKQFADVRGDLFWAFRQMGSGTEYELKIDECCCENSICTIEGEIEYSFKDKYDFKDDRDKSCPIGMFADDLEKSGKAKGFDTEIRIIQDDFKVTFSCDQCPNIPDPDPEDDEQEDEETTDVDTSYTPEDKFGPAGYDPPGTPEGDKMRYVSPGQTLDYSIEFWNKEDAVVPTQDAVIEDILDPSVFDLSTFEFTRFGFLKWDVPLSGGQTIDTRVDLRPDMDLAVDVTGSFDPETGTIKWWFHCIDPMTGEWPEDPMAGFLPPYNPETGYEIGWVEFRVKLKDDLPNETQIANQAFVEFDFAGDIYDHPAPKDGPWINTIGTTGIVCDGDFDGDGDVDGSDLAVFAADFGRTDCDSGPDCEGDFDEDGDVDGSDLAAFASDFGRTDCPVPQ